MSGVSGVQGDPLLGLLTDIAEGVAALVRRVDGIEARMNEQQDLTNEALAIIAEIATRTYYANKPAAPLPDDVINGRVMDRVIERWQIDWKIGLPTAELEMLKNLASLSTKEVEAQIRARAALAEGDATNAERIRKERTLMVLNNEMGKRLKAFEKSMERDSFGRER